MSVPGLQHDQRGITLIDVILVIILLALAIPPMIALFIQVVQGSTFGVTVARANALAATLVEEIRSKQWDENAPAASLPLGAEGGETRLTYDDVDDFDTLNESPPRDSQGTILAGFNGFRQQVSVCYVANSALDTCLGAGTSNYKRITVTVTDPEGRPTQTVTVISSF